MEVEEEVGEEELGGERVRKRGSTTPRRMRRRASSFVIIRGSVPLEWSQPLRDFFWKYKIIFNRRAKGGVRAEDEKENAAVSAAPLRSHFAELTSRYGRITVVDLLKASRGDEAMLRSTFGRAVSQLPARVVKSSHKPPLPEEEQQEEEKEEEEEEEEEEDRAPATLGEDGGGGDGRGKESSRDVRYVAYDFHAECQDGNDAALTRLLTRLRLEVQAHGQYVEAAATAAVPVNISKNNNNSNNGNENKTSPTTGIIIKTQKGVFRVNCKDCLDRTNLVQSAVGTCL